MRAPSAREAERGEVLLAVEDVSLSFGGVRALTGVSFDIRKGEIRAIIGPNGAGKTSMLNVVNGFYQPQSGRITFKGEVRKSMRPYAAARGGIARTFQNLALFRGMTTLDNILAGRALKMRRGFFWQLSALRSGAARGSRASAPRRGDHRFSGNRRHPQNSGRPPALRLAKARRAWPRAGDGAGSSAARRADGRHEPRRERGHVALHHRREPAIRHHDRADRARYGRGDGSCPTAWSCSNTAARSPTPRPTRSSATRT